ncbi:AAA family ATPase [Microbacterium suaedae]|uniref:AAA family ATPase n=1 Tax=Microbacterium suaedae TaxID=2067813 RepID=UPI000DADBEA8|nr:AAA family ATPase [Microbacterium suaedae]
MRIHRIEIEGFGPFRARQAIDLDQYASDGIFLIAGRTGTGKSSILDAVCFALYGAAPRYDGGEQRYRSDHAEPSDPTSVAVEFSVADHRWRVERSPEYERPKLRGEGTTTAPPKVEVFEQVGGEWVGRAARAVEAGRLIADVVGLNQQQFLQVILLAQGRFARFLLAKNDERQKLLRTLFGTRRFQDYETALDERRRQHRASVDSRTEALRAILDQAHDDLERVEQPENDDRFDDETARPEGSAIGGRADADAPVRVIGAESPADREDRVGPEDAVDVGGRAGAESSADAGVRSGALGTDEPAGAARAAAPDDESLSARISRLHAGAEGAAARAERADAAESAARARRADAEAERDRIRETRDRQTRRDRARAQLAELDSRAEATAARRAELEAARRAATVAPIADAVDRAEAVAATAHADADAAREQWVTARDEALLQASSAVGLRREATGDDPSAAVRPTRAQGEEHDDEGGAEFSARDTAGDAEIPDAVEAEVDDRRGAGVAEAGDLPGADVDEADDLPGVDAVPDVLEAFVDESNRRIGAWQPLREIETLLADETARLDDLRAALAAHDELLGSLTARRDALPGRIAANQSAIDRAAERAARADSVRAHITQLEHQFTALGEVASLAAEYRGAVDDAAKTIARRRAAEDALSALHSQRLAGYAGELAADLTDGDACPVCGSTHHPSPAPLPDDHVTAAQIDAADAERSEAAEQAETADTRRQRIEVDLRAAEERAGGRTEIEVNGDLIAARDQLADAETAAREKAELERERAQLASERDELDERLAEATRQRAALDATIAAGERDLAGHRDAVRRGRGSFPSVAARIGSAQRLASAAATLADADREAARTAGERSARASDLDRVLADARFDDRDAARAAHRDEQSISALDAALADEAARRASAEAALAELAAFDLPEDPLDAARAEEALARAQEALDAAVDARAAARQIADALATAARRAEEAHREVGAAAREADDIARLADAIAGRAHNVKRMNLETFVLAAELEEIVEAANRRLSEMSSGRYALQHTDALARRGAASGLGIEVVDRFTGRPRPAHSLSGGETFLASLSLALGLAEVVTGRAGGVRLDTLFIDEGFGSLDGETLEVAMRTLDELRQGGRTIGVISHVEAMKEQIPAQLRVIPQPQGWSTVDQGRMES